MGLKLNSPTTAASKRFQGSCTYARGPSAMFLAISSSKNVNENTLLVQNIGTCGYCSMRHRVPSTSRDDG